MTTSRNSDRDSFELAHGRVPARPDLNELADLLTEYRRAAIGSAPRPSAALAARLDLSSTPIAMKSDGQPEGETSRRARRAASGLFGLGLTVTIILGAASGAAAVVGAGSAGLLPPGAQNAFDQVVSTIVQPGVVDRDTITGGAPGDTAPSEPGGSTDDRTATQTGLDDSSVPGSPSSTPSSTPAAPATPATSGGNGEGTPSNNGNGNSGSSNGNAGNNSGSGSSSSSNGQGTPSNNGNGNSGSSNGNAGSNSGSGNANSGSSSGSSNSGSGNSGSGNSGSGNSGNGNGNSGSGKADH